MSWGSDWLGLVYDARGLVGQRAVSGIGFTVEGKTDLVDGYISWSWRCVEGFKLNTLRRYG